MRDVESRHYLGIKFYSLDDLAVAPELIHIENRLDQLLSSEKQSLNEILELHNVCLYADSGIIHPSWSKETPSKLEAAAKEFRSIIGRYFNEFNDEKMKQTYRNISYLYLDDFWTLFNKFKLYDFIDDETIKSMLDSEEINLQHLLSHKNTVNSYGNIVSEYMMQHPITAELLIENYLGIVSHASFPNELKPQNRSQILGKYIESDECNLNYLNLVVSGKCDPNDLPISDYLRLCAKKKHEELKEELFASSKPIISNISVQYVENQAEIVIHENTKTDKSLSFQKNWFVENTDYPTILNNFIHVYEFVDCMFRSNFVANPVKESILLATIIMRGKDQYPDYGLFSYMRTVFTMEMLSYYNLLKANGVFLENVLTWFFEAYLDEEFDVSGFTLGLPDPEAELIDKYNRLVIGIERVLRQFKLYVEHFEVDPELLQISQTPITISEIPSMIKDKYVYFHGNESQNCATLLFSDQSAMSYIEKTKEKYRCLYDLLLNEEVCMHDFKGFQQEGINCLISHNYISIDDKDILRLEKHKSDISKDIYNNGYSCRIYLKPYRNTLQNMIDNEELIYQSSLLSDPEQQYFNFIMNDSEFTNSLSLRNRYLHGKRSTDPNIIIEDYMEIMKVLVLLIIKINEEFDAIDRGL